MSALAHLALGGGGAALLMGAWTLVQRHWLRAFASADADALAARRRGGPAGDDPGCNAGCAACGSSRHCATSSDRGT